MKTTALPSVFPAEGTFEFSSIHVDLSCMSPDAVIYYTTDGSQPTTDSAVYHRENGLIPIKSCKPHDTITLRAFAQAPGLAPSRTVDFTYRFACRPKGSFRHQMLREPSDSAAGLIRIEDFDLDKMFLVIGKTRAVLIDAGWDETGDLPALCSELTGGLPVDLVIAHGHPDHIGQAARFSASGSRVYIPHADASALTSLGYQLDFSQTFDLHGDMTFDLGGTVLHTYSAPGHTPGSVVLLDPGTGDLFSSDSFGSNRRYVPDSAWLQLCDCSLESCLRSLEQFLEKAGMQCKRIFTGHNDEILDAHAYLTSFHRALQQTVQHGTKCLQPSLRSAQESFGSGTVAMDGNWRIDPIWACANVKFIYDADIKQTPPRYALGFDPSIHTVL